MPVLIFATHNPHKLQEVQSLLPASIRLLSLQDVGYKQAIPEPYDSLEENSRIKAITIYEALQHDCFAEDSGLEVEALNGAPGARSSRFAGEHATDAENITLLLSRMEGTSRRKARFRTVITLIWKGKLHQVAGTCEGTIVTTPRGKNGFGYDPVFIPEGSQKTFAEMSLEEKNQYSHRAKAIRAFCDLVHQLAAESNTK
ncbi:RdgB/HAM1 family non-canonical purine NTP pyrophosphatase [Thermoflavifilum thermophilum]|uniref:dITP/XTP pyrophosphatase n=1 Tax=Thermoflavifilum thermophilum TaxID=1393122 RepID=A0A1I7N3J9_9BACT|nr:RdgB/HAM1 family non-canonical purine NTP pyrophosphatase [Thermoflavifilum thermophilum]SFV29218.1 XTP/dITP diphosphohydrolase [Thermoflavifilum thermophilum]